MLSDRLGTVLFRMTVHFSALSVLSVLSGCSYLAEHVPGAGFIGPPSAESPVLATTEGKSDGEEGGKAEGSKVPLDLAIRDEINDGRMLYVVGEVVAHTRWPLADPVVVLSGFDREGSKIQVHVVELKKLESGKNAFIESGQRLQVALAIPTAGISNYKVELLWGDDAREYRRPGSGGASSAQMPLPVGGSPAGLPSKRDHVDLPAAILDESGAVRESGVKSRPIDQLQTPPPLPPKVSTARVASIGIDNLDLTLGQVDCTALPCTQSGSVAGVLSNGSDGPVNRVVLGLTVAWIPTSGREEESPEDRVELNNLHLEGGTSKRFRLRLGRGIPEHSGGRFVPRIRVIAVE